MRPKGSFDPNILGFDTSGAWVSVGLWCNGDLGSTTEAMARGQAERLMPMIGAQLKLAGGSTANLDLIAVGVGPGNFTGTRIAVAAARGLSLSLRIPAVGISLFETLLNPSDPDAEPAVIVSLAAPREQAYVQLFRYGLAAGPAGLIDPMEPPSDLGQPGNVTVCGYQAEAIARPFHANWRSAVPQAPGLAVARMANVRRQRGIDLGPRPSPLYVKPPDAAPSRASAPVIVP